MTGEAILSAENSGKPLGGRGSALNLAGGAHSAPQIPQLVGMGDCCLLAKNPTPAIDLQPFRLPPN